MWVCEKCNYSNGNSVDTCFKCQVIAKDEALESKENQQKSEKEEPNENIRSKNRLTIKFIILIIVFPLSFFMLASEFQLSEDDWFIYVPYAILCVLMLRKEIGKKEVKRSKNKTSSKLTEEVRDENKFRKPKEWYFMSKYKNIKSYKSKCEDSVYKGNQLKELIISSNIVYDNIKKLSKTLNGGNKGNLINGKIYYDWESIKLFIKEYGEKKENVDSRISFLMTLECLGFCDWEFGQFTSKELVHLVRYYKNDIDEDRFDRIFSTFLIELEIDKQN
jgi:hypothetical protein